MAEDARTKLVPMLQKLNRRPPNALKHGGFSNLTVLPGEDFAEFVELAEELNAEFKPSGAFEVDQVLLLTRLLWRKQNLRVYLRAEKAREEWAPFLVEDRDPNVAIGIALKARLATIAEQFTARVGNQETLENEAKLVTVAGEVNSATRVLLEWSEADCEKANQEFMVTLNLALLADEITPEKLERELEVMARLDAMIDRTIRRLMQLKAMKPMVGLGGAT